MKAMSKDRLLFIDNLRILLIILVILVHLAITYGAPVGSWYYHEGQPGMIENIFYVFFLAVCQSFFMGFFFLISGYFTPGSYDRKGPWYFLKDRLLRLGIPLIFYIIFIDPLIEYALVLSKGFTGSFQDYLSLYMANYNDLGSGPLWFVEALLIFAFVYVLWRLLIKSTEKVIKIPGNFPIAFFALILGLITFIVRIWLPMGWNFAILNFQIPYFPQYIAMFIVGLVAYRGNWFLQIPEKTGKLWFRIAIIFFILFALFPALSDDPTRFCGGFYWQAFIYALWEQFFGVAVIITLTVLFRKEYNSQGRFVKEMSASAYSVYIFHAPIIVLLALSLQSVVMDPLLKFTLISPLAVCLCFVIGIYIRKFPNAKNIL
jgi:fucose 4-O-acetylase-like acetyltransferase